MDESEFFELSKNSELASKKQQARNMGVAEHIIELDIRVAQRNFKKWARRNLRQQLEVGNSCWQDQAIFALQHSIEQQQAKRR